MKIMLRVSFDVIYPQVCQTKVLLYAAVRMRTCTQIPILSVTWTLDPTYIT